MNETALFLYNTLSRRKEEFVPRESGKVSLYVCGVTPYDAMHIGHARAFIVYDVLRRVLEARGLDVTHVQNVTDVDDKIINRARETGVTAQELAERFAAAAELELASLDVLPAHHYPRVTGHIAPIIQMVETLERKGFAYARGGDVYFDVSKDDDYGKLSGQKPEELEAGARIEPGEHKDDPMDFALWKAMKPGEPAWDSPWGKGRPGWHIECSAMSLELLGGGFDIHGGARELVFPHHENEVAQSESYLDGHTFARTWWHCGELRAWNEDTGKFEKMSKSKGNFVTIADALKLSSPNVWRLFFLMTHPRSPLDYSEERLMQAKSAWSRFQNALAEIELADGNSAQSPAALEFQAKFQAALADDLNTPIALAAVFDAVTSFNSTSDVTLARSARRALETLGFSFQPQPAKDGDSRLTGQLIELLIGVRQTARERRDFAGADAIRGELKQIGITLEDTPDGTRWKLDERLPQLAT